MAKFIVPLFILWIICVGIFEKLNIYDLFISGVQTGLKTVYKIFPYIFAITIISGLIRDTQILDKIRIFNIPSQIIPLILVKPLSGGASTGIVVDVLKEYGADGFIGMFASILMASTETTLYVISVMSSRIKIKNMKLPIICGLIGDATSVIVAIVIASFMHI